MTQQELQDTIITFQVKHNINDNELAFSSHLSVEKVHAMKIGEGDVTPEEISQLLDYIQANM